MSFAPSLVPSRRQFLQLLAARRRLDRGRRVPAFRSRAQGAALFEEVPAGASGITWVHDNAMSAERYLPETMGPGVAFLDYDNDGWMDIYLVNSGPSDFYTPQGRSATRSTRTTATARSPTSPRRRASPAAPFGMGVRGRRLRQRRLSRHVRHRVRHAASLYHNNGNGTFTDVTEKAGVDLAGLDDQRGLVRLRQRRPARSLRLQLRRVRGDQATCSAATTSSGKRFYCIPRVFKPTPSLLYHNNGDGTFTEVSAGTDIERALGKGLGVVATDINNDGRMDLFVANDTVQNFLFMNRGKGKWEEIGAGRRSRLQRQRPAALGHGRRRRRLRRRRLAGSVRRQRRPGDVLALPERRQRDLHRRRARPTASRRRRGC